MAGWATGMQILLTRLDLKRQKKVSKIKEKPENLMTLRQLQEAKEGFLVTICQLWLENQGTFTGGLKPSGPDCHGEIWIQMH